jgi:hypothetical protein
MRSPSITNSLRTKMSLRLTLRLEINPYMSAQTYDASALNNFARLSISAALASPITK